MHASASHSLELAPDRANIEFNLQQQARMVKALRGVLARRQRTTVLQIETHISFVLVDGEHAYKVKKALRTPFLDQSRLALRQQACAEELRLNRRLAPELYLAVVPITGTASAPEIGGQGATIDCAVQMPSGSAPMSNASAWRVWGLSIAAARKPARPVSMATR